MSLHSHIAKKLWVLHERLGSVWQVKSKNALNGRSSVWTQSTCTTGNGEKLWNTPSFGKTSYLPLLTKSTWSMNLINEWGLSFCLAFRTIGTFLCGCFLSSVSMVSLTATLEPGPPTVLVCKSLGFFEGSFTLIQRSNKHPNTQFTIQILTHRLNGDKFPNILPYLASGWKTIIHCRTINQVFQVFAYILHLQSDGTDKLIWAWVYQWAPSKI